jgi:tRNA(Ile)-lysidine synthase
VDNLVEQVQSELLPPGPISKGEKVLVAVSGGVDSMVLLYVLARLSKANQWKLAVAHLNHRLRGSSSDADERLVQRMAKRMKLPFFSERVDVRRLARTEGLSVEMAARKARHEFLARIAVRRRTRYVTLAHHADDQVELFFLRLLRGAGPQGLAGMKLSNPSPANPKVMLVRPFLAIPKSVLRAYAKENRVAFREDASNSQIDFQRNRIRSELLPLLRRHYQPALDRTVRRLADIIQAESDFVTDVARQWLAADPGRRPFEKLPIALQRRCLYLQLLDLRVEADFAMVEQLRLHPGGPICVDRASASGSSPMARVSRDVAGRVSVSNAQVPRFKQLSRSLDLTEGSGNSQFSGVQIGWRTEPYKQTGRIRRHPGRELFDARKIGPSMTLRHWRPGDRFQPIGMSSAVKLQDLFVNSKISRPMRHELVVATSSRGEIFWVEGLRIGERFKLQKNTKHALHWRWQRR